MIDLLALSFKGFLQKKRRNILIIFMICIVVMLLNMYVMMTTCITDMESIKAQDNIEYRRISMYPMNISTGEKKGICLYDLVDIKDIQGIESVSLSTNTWKSAFQQNIDKIIINGMEFIKFNNIVNGHVDEFKFQPLFDSFDPYNVAEEKWIRKFEPTYSALLFGRWPHNSSENEIAIDSITASRFFFSDTYESLNYSEVCDKTVIIITNDGESIECKITGVYDYRVFFGASITKSEEDIQLEEAMLRFRYSQQEIEEGLFYSSDILYPIYLNESLAQKVLTSGDNTNRNFGDFLECYNLIDIMVDDIDNIESVTDELESYGYLLTAETEIAQNAVQRFFFYKNAILLIGIILFLVCILQQISVMIMIVHERTKYITMLSRLGFRKKQIAFIITGEMLWMGFIGSILGIVLCFVSKYFFMHQIQHQLAESGLYRYIIFNVSPMAIVITMVGCIGMCFLIGEVFSWIIINKETNHRKNK